MRSNRHTKLLIIGSGPAGYTAAVYGARALLEPVLVQGIQPGGQLTITTDVENWPGDDSVLGPDLMLRMEAHAKAAGTEILSGHISSVDLSKRPFTAVVDDISQITCDSMILATGAQARWLGLESEEKFKGYGVSACATCDGFFFRNQDIAVVGGGNTAVEEALFLTKFAKSLTLIHRRDELRAEKILQKRLFANKKITPLWNHTVEEVLGKNSPKSVTGVKVRNTKTGVPSTLGVTGLFIAIGHTPASSLIDGQIKTREGGYVVTLPGSTATSVPGVFAAGDLVDSVYRQAVTSAGMGCMAALDAEKYLSELTSVKS